MLYVTQKAAEMVQLSAQANNCEEQPLRISAFKDEAGHIQYRMGFDPNTQPNDVTWDSNGITLRIAQESQELLEHVVLDFQDLPPGGPQFAFVAQRPQTTPSP